MASSRAPRSAPIPIPVTHPTELHTLISARRWPAVIERCRTHPHEVGTASHLRNERGYTALHTLVAYNQLERVEDLIPVAKALLKAADEVDYGATYKLGDGREEIEQENKINTNEVEDEEATSVPGKEGRRSGGSWRLLLDQNNHAQWCPLHIMCVHGGLSRGKVMMVKALLQMSETSDEEENEEVRQYQHQILTLLDRQDRNLLHHLLDSVVPSDETFEAVRFVVEMAPQLLFVRDANEKTPLAYVLERISENPGTRRRHFMNSFAGNDDEGLVKNYRMLKLLVYAMETETRGWGEMKARGNDVVPDGDAVSITHGSTTNDDSRPINVLHAACRLPRSACPFDGSLLIYLCSPDATKLEAKVREKPSDDMSIDVDEEGNQALHVFVSNASYVTPSNGNNTNSDASEECDNTAYLRAEWKIMQALGVFDKDRKTGFTPSSWTPNDRDQLPLHIAMKTGRRHAVAILLLESPKVVLQGDTAIDAKIFAHVLGSIAVPQFIIPDEDADMNDSNFDTIVRQHCHTIMFDLVRARPDIVSLAGATACGRNSDRNAAYRPGKKKWWRILPFL
ncbi:hypothetical protein ACHAXT_011417 [Thalassiosira profunda]